MAFIKSALELAMEKTEGLTVDKEELHRKELFDQGRISVVKSLQEDTALWDALDADKLKELKDPDYKIWLEGASEALLSRIQLTYDPKENPEFPKIITLLDKVTHQHKTEQIQALPQILSQFLEEFQGLKDAIAQQLGPALKQRAQQAGNAANYVMERDPNYIKVLSENLDPLKKQYEENLKNLKDEIKKL